MKADKKFLSAAYKQAVLAGKKDEVPVGAVIVLNGEVIARGQNTRESKQIPTGHAELVAVLKACKKVGSWRLEGCDVYVTLEPCPMCAAVLQQARVRAVYYGARDPKAGAESVGLNLHQNTKLNHRYTMTCLEDESCSVILKEFFKKKRGK